MAGRHSLCCRDLDESKIGFRGPFLCACWWQPMGSRGRVTLKMGHSLKHDFVPSRTVRFLQLDLAVAHHLCTRRPGSTAVTLTLSSGDRLIGNLASPAARFGQIQSRNMMRFSGEICVVLYIVYNRSRSPFALALIARLNCFCRQMRCAV